MLSPNPTLHYMWQWGKLPPLATHQDIICALTRRLCEEGQTPSGLDNYVSSLGSLTFSRRPQLPLLLQDPVFKNANHLPEESETDGRGRGTWYQHTKYKELGVTYSHVGWDVRKASFSYGNSFKISKSQWATFFCEFLLFFFLFIFTIRIQNQAKEQDFLPNIKAVELVVILIILYIYGAFFFTFKAFYQN